MDVEKNRRMHIAVFVALGFFLVAAFALEGAIIVEALKDVWASESHSY